MIIDRSKNIKSVLTLMPDCHIGNLVVSLPAIVALQQYFKGATHHFVVDAAFKEIVETVIDPAYTMFYPRKQTNQGNIVLRMLTYYKFLGQIKKIHPDIVVDLEGGSTSATLCKISGAPISFSRANADKSSVYTVKVPLSQERHKVYNYTDIASAVGAKIDEKPFRFYPEEKKKQKVEKLLIESGITEDRPIVCIHPGAGRLQKLWTISGFVDVTEWLTHKGCQVVFIGGPAEAERAEEIIALLSRQTYNYVGKLSLGELLALLEKSTVFLGNDSGPMHMAAAMGTAVVAMFSYANDTEWGPRSKRFKVLRGQKSCEDCLGKKCQNPVCINTLSAEPVKEALSSFLDDNCSLT